MSRVDEPARARRAAHAPRRRGRRSSCSRSRSCSSCSSTTASSGARTSASASTSTRPAGCTRARRSSSRAARSARSSRSRCRRTARPAPLGGDEGVVVTRRDRRRRGAAASRAAATCSSTSRGALSGALPRARRRPPEDGRAGRALREGDELLGRDPPSLDRVLQRTWDNMTTAARVRRRASRPRCARAATPSSTSCARRSNGIAPDVTLRATTSTRSSTKAARTYAALGGDARASIASTAMVDHGAHDDRAGARDDRGAARECGRAVGERCDGCAAGSARRAARRSTRCELAIDACGRRSTSSIRCSRRSTSFAAHRARRGLAPEADARPRVPRGREGARQDHEASAVEDHRAACRMSAPR